jgi:flagellar export protein FliJ
MERLNKKIKRVKPLIRFREKRLLTETEALNKIRQVKLETIAKLKENQRLYLEGLKTLNHERQSGQSGRLLTLESSLDVVKNRWFESLKELRKVEEQEKIQIVQVMIAQKDVKTLEKLEDRYKEQLSTEIKKIEQKEIDEIALRGHSRGQAEG